MPVLDRRDYWLALLLTLFALAIYTRVLAPDLLYNDSAEFQTLGYTGGTTHPTGYPVYLVLARGVGLLPVNTPAWRINFLSALAAAVTIGGVYLLARHLTGRGGAVVGSLALLVSYTFWSQSLIAEVYTPAAAFIVSVLLVLLSWQRQPQKRPWLLFGAGFLLTLGLGVHLFLMLIVPSVGLFVLWGIVAGAPEERRQWGNLARLAAGMAAGMLVFFGLFALNDSIATPANFYATTVMPSRDAWGLEASDLDSVPERFWLSFSGFQWRDAMLPPNIDYQEVLSIFFDEYLPRQYNRAALLLAAIGAIAALMYQRRRFVLFGSAIVVAFGIGLVYHPGDKHLFYLPVYVLMAVLIGVGAGFIITQVLRILPARVPRALPEVALSALLITLCVFAMLPSRLDALQAGEATFITEDYIYPVGLLDEPRANVECALSKIPEDRALLVLGWRASYATYYIAHVEQGRTGIEIHESRPHGTRVITPNHIAEVQTRLENGETVYIDHDELWEASFDMTRIEGGCKSYSLLKLELRD